MIPVLASVAVADAAEPEPPRTAPPATLMEPVAFVLLKYSLPLVSVVAPLNATQSLFMQPRKPELEFYDLQADPHEVNNLASSAKHQPMVKKFSAMLDRWIEDSGDMGREPEKPEAAVL